ncbi:Patatin-like protein 3, partial [Mucuna pruriens]
MLQKKTWDGLEEAVFQENVELQAKDPTVPLYFDVIAGTSTGGIMTAMLTATNSSDTNFPLYTPREIVHFYKKNDPHIFNLFRYTYLRNIFIYYNETFLYNITCGLLKETPLRQTLVKVVVPTFDLKQLKPVIF